MCSGLGASAALESTAGTIPGWGGRGGDQFLHTKPLHPCIAKTHGMAFWPK